MLKVICEAPNRRAALIEWTRELTPMDVQDLEFPTDTITGRVQLAFREANGRSVSAWSASDGTLRFLAMTEDAVVRPVVDLPNAGRLRGSQGLGRLHTSGWMEDAILFDTGGEAGDGA